MVKIFRDMLAVDRLAQNAGCGLKPELRAAMEASLRFPAVAASPMSKEGVDPSNLPENVVSLEAAVQVERKQA